MKKYEGLDCIMLVDDDSATNYLHKLIINKADVDVHTQIVTNGVDAIDYLRHENKFSLQAFPLPGIIFLDINMPKMNGWEFLEEYKELPSNRKAKAVVIMLTNSLNPGDLDNASKNPDVSMFINKPLTKEILDGIISRFYTGNVTS